MNQKRSGFTLIEAPSRHRHHRHSSGVHSSMLQHRHAGDRHADDALSNLEQTGLRAVMYAQEFHDSEPSLFLARRRNPADGSGYLGAVAGPPTPTFDRPGTQRHQHPY